MWEGSCIAWLGSCGLESAVFAREIRIGSVRARRHSRTCHLKVGFVRAPVTVPIQRQPADRRRCLPSVINTPERCLLANRPAGSCSLCDLDAWVVNSSLRGAAAHARVRWQPNLSVMSPRSRAMSRQSSVCPGTSAAARTSSGDLPAVPYPRGLPDLASRRVPRRLTTSVFFVDHFSSSLWALPCAPL